MVSDRYQEFIEASRNLDLFPLLETDKIEKFRVTYGLRTLARLQDESLAAGDADKVFFTGHRGCGKSTLLARLPRLIFEENNLFVSLLFHRGFGGNVGREPHQYFVCHCSEAAESSHETAAPHS